jgi:hypothetical protein
LDKQVNPTLLLKKPPAFAKGFVHPVTVFVILVFIKRTVA